MTVRRSPWPLALLLCFALFVATQFTLISMAAHGFEPPDDPQYYEHGLSYGDQIRQQEQQRKLGWALGVNLPSTLQAGHELRLVARPHDAAGRPLTCGRCELSLSRPATSRDDVRVPMLERAPGVYAASVTPRAGWWDVRLQLHLAGHTFSEQARVEARP
jgi:nitrogen fixation protein FixH